MRQERRNKQETLNPAVQLGGFVLSLCLMPVSTFAVDCCRIDWRYLSSGTKQIIAGPIGFDHRFRVSAQRSSFPDIAGACLGPVAVALQKCESHPCYFDMEGALRDRKFCEGEDFRPPCDPDMAGTEEDADRCTR